jgi:Putative DNA-binding domain
MIYKIYSKLRHFLNFDKPTMNNINEFLEADREQGEGRTVEFKSWLDLAKDEHKAKLIKACLALYHENGGRLWIGLKDDGNYDEVSNSKLEQYEATNINNLLQQYCNLPNDIKFEKNDSVVLIEVIPGVVKPIFAKKEITKILKQDILYMRTYRPNNTISTDSAKVEDYEILIKNCIDNRDADISQFIRKHITDEFIAKLGQMIKSQIQGNLL